MQIGLEASPAQGGCLTGKVIVLNGSRDEEVNGPAQKPRVQTTDRLKAQFSSSFDRQPHALQT